MTPNFRYQIYNLSQFKDEDIKGKAQFEQTYPEGIEVTMTLAEVFRNEGIEEGIEKGLEKGETRV